MSARNEIQGIIPTYPGVKRIGWLPAGSITEEQQSLLDLGDMTVSIGSAVTWVQTLDTPTLGETRSLGAQGHGYVSELSFKVEDIQFPKDSSWVIVDAQDTVWLVGGHRTHSGEYEVKRTTSQASGEAVCLSVRLTIPFRPQRIILG